MPRTFDVYFRATNPGVFLAAALGIALLIVALLMYLRGRGGCVKTNYGCHTIRSSPVGYTDTPSRSCPRPKSGAPRATSPGMPTTRASMTRGRPSPATPIER